MPKEPESILPETPKELTEREIKQQEMLEMSEAALKANEEIHYEATGKLYLFRISNGRGPVEIYTAGRFISLPEEVAYRLRETIARAEERADAPTYSTHNGQDAEQGLR